MYVYVCVTLFANLVQVKKQKFGTLESVNYIFVNNKCLKKLYANDPISTSDPDRVWIGFNFSDIITRTKSVLHSRLNPLASVIQLSM